MPITNTTAAWSEDPREQDRMIATSMVTGSPSLFIETQERDGQDELVNSEMLPSDHGDDAPWLALGFTFGEPDPSDPLFCPATLPAGWEKRATDHSMGSVIVDPLGRERVSIFYKAAFYDRKASMNLIGLHWYVEKAVEYDGPAVIFDDEWATREAVLETLKEARQRHRDDAAEFRGYAADTDRRDSDNREHCARIAGEREAKAALYDSRIAELSEG